MSLLPFMQEPNLYYRHMTYYIPGKTSDKICLIDFSLASTIMLEQLKGLGFF